MATVSVTIDGKTYRMACDAGQEEHLTGLAQKFDQYINHLKTSFGEIGDHRLSVMAGIMVMDELSETQRQQDALKQEIELLRDENAKLLLEVKNSDEIVTKAINKAAVQIENLASKLASKN